MNETTSPPPRPAERLPVRAPLVTEPLGILASLRAARRNLLEIIPDLATRVPMVSGRTGARWHMLMEPGAIREVLLERVDGYPKSMVTKNMLRPAIGESMFIAEGAHWRWQRRAAAPAFSARNVGNLGPIMAGAAGRAADRIDAQRGHAVDLFEEMVTTTFDVISDVTFSGGEAFARDAVHRAIDGYIAEAGRISLFDVLGLPDWVPRPGRLRAGGLVEMKSVADAAIDDRARRGPREVPDLLDLLLAGEDPETQRRMNIGELRDNLLTFIVAGHETTALTLSWALYLLAFDQDAQERARAEVLSGVAGETASAAEVEELPYLRRVVEETLRLYPPAGIVSRTAQRADELCGREIKPGDTVMIPIYALHRSHRLWDAPDAFRPDRFEEKPQRYAYLPFGDGPRICIGAAFAVQEALIVLATLLKRFRFTPVAGRDPEPVMILTLRPEGGVWLEAEPL
ncbi:cytochrome P450 [Alloyangia pacifica]|uniref:Cytochrome P450 n=1 Tax=Alloyangia pacifica TaxID=311180 RepID=A0A1I6WNC3_9RHOB|nr:cytochrome P450 [Alloyangia pacifica]SDI96435.1 Cytochrome P450 [Alloyangia pacifica]SFT27416.1 Cytochrome P450 [Alloyangia pacifica]